MEKKIEQFEKFRGKILSMAVHVESTLDSFISNYFIKPQNAKTFFFEDIILLNGYMSFERKINIFEEICKREKFNNISKIVESIRYVQKIRNNVAHWQVEISSPNQIILRKRKSYTTKKDILELNEELIKILDEKRLKAINGINELHLKYHTEGTIDERQQADFL